MKGALAMSDALFLWLFSQTLLLRIKVYASVDFRFRMLAFRRVGGEPPRCKHLRGLTCPTAPAGVSHLTLQSTNFLFLNNYFY